MALLISKKFNELTTTELYEILKSRYAVFTEEQKIICLDEDDMDYKALHCFFMENKKVTAYLRAFYDKQNPDTVKMGRVLTLVHNKGTGTDLVNQSISAIKEKMPCKKIHVDAQLNARNFYKKLGFAPTSGEYIEAGIPHIDMELFL